MDFLGEAKKGNKIYQVTFPDGTIVPFRLLTWHEFGIYWDILQKGNIPHYIVEEAIFRECILDVVSIDYENIRAGVIPSIVTLIMHLSGPAQPESFNDMIQLARAQVDTLNSQIVMVICRAFPGYTPEMIEAMPWRMVLIRLAQAERILMSKDPPELAEPLRVLSEQEIAKMQKRSGPFVNANDLVADGQKALEEDRRAPRDPRLSLRDRRMDQLTPEQMRQVKQIQEVQRRRRG